MRIMSVLTLISDSEDRICHCFDKLWPNFLLPWIAKSCLFKAICIFKECSELTCFPHVVHNLMFSLCYDLPGRFWVLVIYTCITEMSKLIPDFIWVIILACKAAVGLLIHPNNERMDAGHQYPLPDIKFFSYDNKRLFDILLSHPAAPKFTWLIHSMEQFSEIIVDLDTSTSRLTTRLDNPLISHISQSKLLCA